MNKSSIAYVGMTHLGLNSAVAGAEHGFNVICYDPDAELIGRLEVADLPVLEPDLPELLAKNSNRLTFTHRIEDIGQCDVVYIAPDVATDDQGKSDLSDLEILLDLAEPHVRSGAVEVILSQVPPGFTRTRLRDDRIVYYQVETLIFGRAMERALYPERFIIGCKDPAAQLPVAYQTYLESFDCPLLPMRFESAELAKISINCCLVASVSVANTLAELCEEIGADWSEIVPALKLDKRIGQFAYLNPGLGIAGGNLERDLETVIGFSEQVGIDAGVVKAWTANSRHRKMAAALILRKQILTVNPDPLIAVWGLAYKENTHSIKNSPSLATLAAFPSGRFRVHDPVVPAEVSGHPGASTPIEAIAGADVLMILTPWQEYKEIPLQDIVKSMAGKTIIDPYRVLDSQAVKAAGLEYFTLGVASTHI